jgi:ABC-type antimicrobial peptide transport system permease subunit
VVLTLAIALGAEPANVSRMVLRQVGWMVAIGLPIGLGLALSVGQLAATQLFGLTPTDPLAALAAAGVLAAAVLGAAYGPARRAARIEPAMALRAE